jgi:hypothetical protein
MSINLDHPGIEAADQIGLFKEYDALHGHPSEDGGWTRAVVMKMIEDDQRFRYAGMNDRSMQMAPGLDRSKYSADELAAYDWYETQTRSDRWKDLVTDYQKKDADTRSAEPDPFAADRDYLSKPDPTVEGLDRKPFDGKAGQAGSIAISTEAILYFANVLESIAPMDGGSGPLRLAIDRVDGIDPRPGAFGKAEVHRRTLVASGPESPGLAGETTKTMVDLQAVFAAAQVELRALVKDYDSAEELNTLTVKQFGDATTRSTTRIDALGAPATKEKA